MTTKKGIPKTKNKKIKKVFNQATSDVDKVKKGEKVPDEKGLFDESREFLAFEVAKATETSISGLTKAEAADTVLMEIFRDAREDPTPADVIQSMTLCLYGLALGNYNEEDFRYLYRYSLRHVRNQNQIESWLRKGLVFLAATKHDSAKEVMSEVRFWLQFLGAPVFSIGSFSDVGDDFGVDIKSVLDSEDLRLVDALTRHP
ncbi:MAG: hypothetical protein ACXABX_09515, partial [Candidatus Thorarchaeota archaeon]